MNTLCTCKEAPLSACPMHGPGPAAKAAVSAGVALVVAAQIEGMPEPLPKCPMDTDGDGNCHLCAHAGGCAAYRAERVRDLNKILALTREGFAGIIQNGRIVDRRQHPEALPIQANSFLGVPKPKPLPPVPPRGDGTTGVPLTVPCPGCEGTGRYGTHLDGGPCARCMGGGRIENPHALLKPAVAPKRRALTVLGESTCQHTGACRQLKFADIPHAECLTCGEWREEGSTVWFMPVYDPRTPPHIRGHRSCDLCRRPMARDCAPLCTVCYAKAMAGPIGSKPPSPGYTGPAVVPCAPFDDKGPPAVDSGFDVPPLEPIRSSLTDTEIDLAVAAQQDAKQAARVDALEERAAGLRGKCKTCGKEGVLTQGECGACHYF